MISHQAPELCQFADEELIREIGALVYPHFVERTEGENGLRLWVEGSTPDDQTRETARLQFRVLLGAIRSWRDGAGELEVEQQDGLGPAAARDQDGNQWMALGGARVYILSGDPQLMFGADVAAAISRSVNLTNSLWLNGRTSRNAADYYMIHEYAERQFGGTDGIRSALGLPVGSQKRLTQSANNLSPP